MSGRFRALALVLLVVLAGCATSYAANPLWTGDDDNPWREETLTVAVHAPPGDARNYQPLVRQALDYWEQHAEQYAGYPIAYQIDDDSADPDLNVSFVPDVTDCGSETHTAGCAPVLTEPTQVHRPVTVRVRTDFSDASTVRVLEHELGHTLGLSHSDAPQPLMAARSQLTTLPQPNATERALPWNHSDLRVYVDDAAVASADRAEVERQIGAALDYYDRGAEGTVPENVSFVRVDDPARADVVVEFRDTDACTAGSGTCGSVAGVDPDGDGALERYTKLHVTVVGIDPAAVGWHVGYWLGYGFGFDENSDYPPPFRDASYEERRSEWWR
ncbi:MAG: matrixin family metalloprotease [Haloarculaceae archaeon]